MLDGKKIIVLHNTYYHFETALSIYKSLEDAGAEVLIRQLCNNSYGQKRFMELLNMRTATDIDLEEASCAFVVSAYPNPHVKRPDAVPEKEHPSMKMFVDRLVYISHRFGSCSDYNSDQSPVRPHNTVCLSPLSEKIGIDYISPIDMPIRPKMVPFEKPVKFTIQGHFELNNRTIQKWVLSMEDGSDRSNVTLLGGLLKGDIMMYRNQKNTFFFPNQQETPFYKILNRHTNFILPLIDGSMKDGTYIKERFSSNFNQAFALEKPVLCHEVFREIYGTPGLYYNDQNQAEVAERIFEMNQDDYKSLVSEFKAVKRPMREHNTRVLAAKVAAVGG